LKDAVSNAITNSLNLLENFNKLREGDPMIYFPTPDRIGIGVSRGLACCISSDGRILDYSGRVINLASRLNDLARPCGIVFDSGLGLALLPKSIQELFLQDSVYVRGIAEEKPLTVYYTKQYTIIPPFRKQPMQEPKWLLNHSEDIFRIMKKNFASGDATYDIELEKKPFDTKQVYVEVNFTVNDEPLWFDLAVGDGIVEYMDRGTKHYIRLKYDRVLKNLEKLKVKDDSVISFDVSYPII
jgi:hypothetical protein